MVHTTAMPLLVVSHVLKGNCDQYRVQDQTTTTAITNFYSSLPIAQLRRGISVRGSRERG